MPFIQKGEKLQHHIFVFYVMMFWIERKCEKNTSLCTVFRFGNINGKKLNAPFYVKI